MARRERASVDRYLPQAILATSIVVLLPAGLFAVALSASGTSPVSLGAVCVVLALAGAALGSGVWRRRPESVDLTFGELMIWGWVRRKRAERRVAQGVKLLGINGNGGAQVPCRVSVDDQLQLLKTLNAALESKDPYTHGHSGRVERHVHRIAVAMGLSPEQIREVRLAAALHDVGKIRIPDRILRKPGRLTIDEQLVLHEHALVGAWMVAGVGSDAVVEAVRNHHERWDGRGYPDGLEGESIPLFARMIAVADAYDAMTSTRSYRPSFSHEVAIDVVKSESGAQFDRDIADTFIATLPERTTVAGWAALLWPRRWSERAAEWLSAARDFAPSVGAAGAAAVIGFAAFSPGNVERALEDSPPQAEAATDPSHRVAVELSGEDRVLEAGTKVLARRLDADSKGRRATVARSGSSARPHEDVTQKSGSKAAGKKRSGDGDPTRQRDDSEGKDKGPGGGKEDDSGSGGNGRDGTGGWGSGGSGGDGGSGGEADPGDSDDDSTDDDPGDEPKDTDDDPKDQDDDGAGGDNDGDDKGTGSGKEESDDEPDEPDDDDDSTDSDDDSSGASDGDSKDSKDDSDD